MLEWCRRGNFPLKLSWGLIIYKSQGLTLDKETINIGNKEIPSVTFTTIYQVKSLSGVRVQPHFTYELYEMMTKWVEEALRKLEGKLRLITL